MVKAIGQVAMVKIQKCYIATIFKQLMLSGMMDKH